MCGMPAPKFGGRGGGAQCLKIHGLQGSGIQGIQGCLDLNLGLGNTRYAMVI